MNLISTFAMNYTTKDDLLGPVKDIVIVKSEKLASSKEKLVYKTEEVFDRDGNKVSGVSYDANEGTEFKSRWFTEGGVKKTEQISKEFRIISEFDENGNIKKVMELKKGNSTPNISYLINTYENNLLKSVVYTDCDNNTLLKTIYEYEENQVKIQSISNVHRETIVSKYSNGLLISETSVAETFYDNKVEKKVIYTYNDLDLYGNWRTKIEQVQTKGGFEPVTIQQEFVYHRIIEYYQ
jgi:hypothetical protein